MAYIDIDEPAPEKQVPPTGKVERRSSQKSSTASSKDSRKLALYTLAALATAFVIFQIVKLNNEANKLQQQTTSQLTAEEADPSQEARTLTEKIGQYLELPDETPTVATVTDASKVSSQAFFARAQDNDKVLLFEKSGRAVLYRPSTNKVIEFATTN